MLIPGFRCRGRGKGAGSGHDGAESKAEGLGGLRKIVGPKIRGDYRTPEESSIILHFN